MRFFTLFILGSLVAASPAVARVIRVDISNIAFSPASISAHVGDTIEWDNKDFVAHSATARSGEWDINLPPHKTGKVVLKKAQRLDYYCKYHPNMKGEITVSQNKPHKQ